MKKRLQGLILPAACYLLAGLIYLVLSLAALVGDGSRAAKGQMPTLELGLDDVRLESAIHVNAEAVGGDIHRSYFVSTDPDPQLVYTPDAPLYVRVVELRAESNLPGGEMVLFYTTAPGQDYSDRQKVWATQGPDGAWRFDLSGVRVFSLRLDPDTRGGVLWAFDGITVNRPLRTIEYFVPDAFGLFLLLALPAFAAAALLEAGRVLLPALAARRKKNRKEP